MLRCEMCVCLAVGRSLIPRYFRSMFEGGITDLYYVLKYCKESFQNTSIILDCEQAMMVTHHSKPVFTKVELSVLLVSFMWVMQCHCV